MTATPAVDLVPNVLATPFLRTLTARPRGGFWDMGKPVSLYTLLRLAPGEATSACRMALLGIESNRVVVVTGSKSWLDLHGAGRQGSPQTVGEAV